MGKIKKAKNFECLVAKDENMKIKAVKCFVDNKALNDKDSKKMAREMGMLK